MAQDKSMLERVHLEASAAVGKSMLHQVHLEASVLCMRSCRSTSKRVVIDKPMREQDSPGETAARDKAMLELFYF